MCVRERQIRGDFQKSLMTFVKIKNSQNSDFIYIYTCVCPFLAFRRAL